MHGDVVALASETGAILARYAYDGFGRILLSEHDAAGTGPQGTQSIKATANRVGHKGLFFDRYDTPHGWTPGSGIDGLPPTLAAATTGSSTQAGSWASGGVKGLYYNRNRHFSPSLGRFVQRDPNATGLVLAAVPAMHGQLLSSVLPPFDAEWHYVDGPNTHAAYAGGPTLVGDPMGLFGLAGGLMTGLSMASSAKDAMNQAYQGVTIQAQLASMLLAYGLLQDADVDWALDWSRNDDWIDFTGQSSSSGTSDQASPFGESDHVQAGLRPGRQSKSVREAGMKNRNYSSPFQSRKFTSKKEAREAAQRLCAPGQKPVHHPGHKPGELPHFQPVDANGNVIKGMHFRYPQSQR